jgi:hypothetical protein
MPAVQLIVMDVAYREATTSLRLSGASGLVRITAPLPTFEVAEFP